MKLINRLFICTGASGAGKTAVVNHFKTLQLLGPLHCLHFDKIGVPTLEEMERVYGAAEEWQRKKTQEWMEEIQREYLLKSDVLLEGQMRIAFLLNSLQRTGMSTASIVLIDCNDEARKQRLVHNRQQPELANVQMMNWATHLRNEAKANGIPVVDTSNYSEEQSAISVARVFGLMR